MSKNFDVLDQILMKICLKNDIKIENIYDFYASGNHHHVYYAKVGYFTDFCKNVSILHREIRTKSAIFRKVRDIINAKIKKNDNFRFLFFSKKKSFLDRTYVDPLKKSSNLQ